jgi:hypothetical protein
MVFECDVFVDTLPYGYALLEESLAFMESLGIHLEMAPKDALMRHPKDFLHL